MFKNTKIVELERTIWKLEQEKEIKSRIYEIEINKVRDGQKLEIEKAVISKQKEMEQALIKSDLLRVEAVAKLNTYIDMDTKDDRKTITKMLEKAVEGLSSARVQIVK